MSYQKHNSQKTMLGAGGGGVGGGGGGGEESNFCILTLLHSERPKLYAILAFLSAIELRSTNTSGQVKVPKRLNLRMA